MNKWFIFVLFNAIRLTFGAEEVRPLCDNPVITSADHLSNGTIRVYRDSHYWELTSLPDRVAQVHGPFRITHQYMAPVTRNTSIMTVLSGPIAGNTWKFEKDRQWQWNEKGKLELGGKSGVQWSNIPRGGFHCAMNDGDYDKKGYSQMIALKAIRAYYWKTSQKIFTPVGDIYQGFQRGQFEEDFPPDITACTAFKAADDGVNYHVYLFKRDKYCFRTIKGVKGCPDKDWRDNRELFGCQAKTTPTGDPKKPNDGNTGNSGNTGGGGKGDDGGSKGDTGAPVLVPDKAEIPPKKGALDPTTKPGSGAPIAPTTQKLLLLFAICLYYIF